MAHFNPYEVRETAQQSIERISFAILDLVTHTERVLVTTEKEGERRAIYEHLKPDNVIGLAAVSSTVGAGGNIYTVQFEPFSGGVRETFRFTAPDIEETQVRETQRPYQLFGKRRYRKPTRQERSFTPGEVEFMWQVVGGLMKQRQQFGEVQSVQA